MSQATFDGEFWETPRRDDVDAAIADTSGSPDATFSSTHVDYPQGAAAGQQSSLPLSNFLGTDAPSIAGNGAAVLTTSIIRFSGFIELAPGPHSFSVGSDDGYRLIIDGNVVSEHPRVRGFRTTTVTQDVGSGVLPFELWFFERTGNTGVDFYIDGVLAAPAPYANVISDKSIALHREDDIGCGSIPGAPDPAAQAAIPGACMEYVISVDNSGPGTAYSLSVDDRLDDRLVFQGASQSGFATDDPAFSFDVPAPGTDCGLTPCDVTIGNARLAPGAQGTIIVRALLK